MSIRDWPAAERPREKLLQHGSGSLSDAELLAIFLRTGVSGKSAVDLARHLLSEFGSLRALLEALTEDVHGAFRACLQAPIDHGALAVRRIVGLPSTS